MSLLLCTSEPFRAYLAKTEGGGATAPFGDYFTCRNGCFGSWERKRSGRLCGVMERNRRIQTGFYVVNLQYQKAIALRMPLKAVWRGGFPWR